MGAHGQAVGRVSRGVLTDHGHVPHRVTLALHQGLTDPARHDHPPLPGRQLVSSYRWLVEQ